MKTKSFTSIASILIVSALVAMAPFASAQEKPMKTGVAEVAKLLVDGYGQTNLVTPAFGQLISMSYPEGFQPSPVRVWGAQHKRHLRSEHLMKGETARNWTQAMAINGAEGFAASDPQLSPAEMVDIWADDYKLDCPSTYSQLLLREDVKIIGGQDAVAAVIACGAISKKNASSKENHSTAAMIIAIKGERDYYVFNWSERGEPVSVPIKLDRAKWMGRLNALMPIRLCPIIPGETAPYPSCPNRTPLEKQQKQ